MTKIIFWACLVLTMLLLVASFIAPPTGVIDPSALKAGSLLFAFATLDKLPGIIKGRNVEIKHGDTSVNIEENKENSE